MRRSGGAAPTATPSLRRRRTAARRRSRWRSTARARCTSDTAAWCTSTLCNCRSKKTAGHRRRCGSLGWAASAARAATCSPSRRSRWSIVRTTASCARPPCRSRYRSTPSSTRWIRRSTLTTRRRWSQDSCPRAARASAAPSSPSSAPISTPPRPPPLCLPRRRPHRLPPPTQRVAARRAAAGGAPRAARRAASGAFVPRAPDPRTANVPTPSGAWWSARADVADATRDSDGAVRPGAGGGGGRCTVRRRWLARCQRHGVAQRSAVHRRRAALRVFWRAGAGGGLAVVWAHRRRHRRLRERHRARRWLGARLRLWRRRRRLPARDVGCSLPIERLRGAGDV